MKLQLLVLAILATAVLAQNTPDEWDAIQATECEAKCTNSQPEAANACHQQCQKTLTAKAREGQLATEAKNSAAVGTPSPLGSSAASGSPDAPASPAPPFNPSTLDAGKEKNGDSKASTTPAGGKAPATPAGSKAPAIPAAPAGPAVPAKAGGANATIPIPAGNATRPTNATSTPASTKASGAATFHGSAAMAGAIAVAASLLL